MNQRIFIEALFVVWKLRFEALLGRL